MDATTTFAYDANGNPTSRDHDDQTSDYTYGPRDLVDTVTVQDTASTGGPKVSEFTYTPRGQRDIQTKDNGNTVDHDYYLDGLLAHKVETKPDGTVGTGYLAADRRQSGGTR